MSLLPNVPSAALESSVPKFATISITTSSAIVNAVTGKKIRVLVYSLNMTGATRVDAKFQSGAAGTDLTKLKYLTSTSNQFIAPYCPVGHFETAAAAALYLNLSTSVQVDGEVTYVEVDV